MANITTTLGSLLGAVATVADKTASTVVTVTKGVDMLDIYVSEALTKQRVESTLRLVNFNETVEDRFAIELAVERTKLNDVLKNDPELKTEFEKAKAILKQARENSKAE